MEKGVFPSLLAQPQAHVCAHVVPGEIHVRYVLASVEVPCACSMLQLPRGFCYILVASPNSKNVVFRWVLSGCSHREGKLG